MTQVIFNALGPDVGPIDNRATQLPAEPDNRTCGTFV